MVERKDHDRPSSPDDTRVEALLRDMTPADLDLVEPPADLWDRIAAEVAADAEGDDAATGTDPSPLPPPQVPASGTVVSLESRRSRRWTAQIMGAAAAVVALLVGAAALVMTRDAGSDTEVVASASLTFDATRFDQLGADASASVSLVEDGSELRIQIDQATLPDTSGEDADLELWLIEPDADGTPVGLVALGLIDLERPGSFAVPPGLDPGVFYVVDISVEPRDGDETHSGRSILRGLLETA